MLHRLGFILLVATAIVACDDGPAGLPDLTVASVSVGPSGQTIVTGATMKLTVVPKAADGTPLGGRPVVWASDATDVAAVSPDGTVLGGQPGSARITATVEGKVGSVDVSVVAAPLEVAQIRILNAPAGLEVGQHVLLEAELRAADGTLIGGRTVTWRSNSGSTASVTRDPNPIFAVLSAHAAGTAVITAEVANRSASVTVTVSAPGTAVGSIVLGPTNAGIWVNGSQPFAVTVRTPTGDPHPNPPVLTWTVDDATIATVDAAGRVRGLRSGTTNVRATGGGVQGSAQVTVSEFIVDNAQFEVRADAGPDGAPRVVELGTLTWYGEDPVNGTPAREILKSGTITLRIADGVTTYTHQVYFDIVVDDGAAGRVVAFGSISDAGTVTSGYDPSGNGPLLTFTSSNAQTDSFYGRVEEDGGILVRQRIAAAPMLDYAWVRK